MLRCWVLLGDQDAHITGMLFPPTAPVKHFGSLPNAANFNPGEIVIWITGGFQVCLVCVDIPVKGGES